MTPHPHIASGMSFLASAVALGSTTIADATVLYAQAAPPDALLSGDNLKWAASMTCSLLFGAAGLYIHINERLEKSRLKLASIAAAQQRELEQAAADARRKQQDDDAAATRRRELAEFEQRVAMERVQLKAEHRTDAAIQQVAAVVAAVVPAAAPAPPEPPK